MGLESYIVPGIVLFIVSMIIIWVLGMRRIVELKYADVRVTKSGSQIYSADSSIERSAGAVYYDIPSWIPAIGCIVKRMPLEIIQITIKNYETFAKENARFNVDVSVYCRISNVSVAAQRFPGNNIEDLRKGLADIIISAIRKTTANYAIEDLISKRQEIQDGIREEIVIDFEKWGVVVTNVAVASIADAQGCTVIQDISAKKESQINSLSRQQIAVMNKTADITEAENRELAETRKIQANEQISIRQQTMDMTVATKQQEAVEKKLAVERTQKETSANIDANASIKTAEGVKQSAIIKAEGAKQALTLEGEGEASKNKSIGLAAADVVKATKVAEAEGLSALADAQKKQQESAKEIRLIEKEQIVGLAIADAMKNAKIEFIGTGSPEKFMDIFTVGGGMSTGASLGTAMKMIKKTDPDLHNKFLEAIGNISGGEKSSPSADKETPSDPLDNIKPENVEALLALLSQAKPEVYEAIRKTMTKHL